MIRVTGKTFQAKDSLKKCGLSWDGSAWVGEESELTSYGKNKLSGICSACNLTLERGEKSRPDPYSDEWVREMERPDSDM